MSRVEEIKARIEELERAEFMIQMNDHMDQEDYATCRKYRNEIRELKEELEKLEGYN